MEKIIYGLKSLKAADPVADGTMALAANLTELCRTHRNSCEFIEDDAQVNEEFCDQADDPIATFTQRASKKLKFNTYDYTPTTLVKLKGGTVVNGKWSEPVVTPEIYQALELTTDSAMVLSYPKCRIIAKFNAKFVKDGVALLEVTAIPISPAPGKPALIIG